VRSHDEYSTAIDHAVADAVRATLVVPHASLQGAHELRQVTTKPTGSTNHSGGLVTGGVIAVPRPRVTGRVLAG
jgi:hypothetical protein